MDLEQFELLLAGVLALALLGLILFRSRRARPARVKDRPITGGKPLHGPRAPAGAPAPAHAAKKGEPEPKAESSEFVYDDLAPFLLYDWLDQGSKKFKAVGWLVKNRPYKRGRPDPRLFQKLYTLLAEPWAPVCIPRRLECPFCPMAHPDHEKKKQPWWAMQRAEVDGVKLVQLRTPETMSHAETHRLAKSGAPLLFETTSLFVPGNGCIYVAHPIMAHFIDAHGYTPPPEFWEAIDRCPPMNSMAYLEGLIANGPQNKLWAAAVWAASVLRVPEDMPPDRGPTGKANLAGA